MPRKQTSLLAGCAVLAALVGCASGSALVTGTKRDAIEPETVKIYLEPPARYETIGLVEATSDTGWTKQGSLDYATKELQKQAAKLGANGVLLQSRGTQNAGAVAIPVGNTWIAAPVESPAPD